MGRAVVVKRWSLTKMTSMTKATKAVIRLDTGPARDTQISPFRQFRKLPTWIERLGPAELGDEQHDQADRVDMSHGVQRKAPHQTRRIIAHPVCHLGMGVFMDDHGDEQAGNSGNNRKYIKNRNDRILLSLIFLLYGI